MLDVTQQRAVRHSVHYSVLEFAFVHTHRVDLQSQIIVEWLISKIDKLTCSTRKQLRMAALRTRLRCIWQPCAHGHPDTLRHLMNALPSSGNVDQVNSVMFDFNPFHPFLFDLFFLELSARSDSAGGCLREATLGMHANTFNRRATC